MDRRAQCCGRAAFAGGATSKWRIIVVREGIACVPDWFFTLPFQFPSTSSSVTKLVLFQPPPKKSLSVPPLLSHTHPPKKASYQEMTRTVTCICLLMKGQRKLCLEKNKNKLGKYESWRRNPVMMQQTDKLQRHLFLVYMTSYTSATRRYSYNTNIVISPY